MSDKKSTKKPTVINAKKPEPIKLPPKDKDHGIPIF